MCVCVSTILIIVVFFLPKDVLIAIIVMQEFRTQLNPESIAKLKVYD